MHFSPIACLYATTPTATASATANAKTPARPPLLNTTFPELDAAVPVEEPVAAPLPAGLLLVVIVRLGVTLVVVPFVVVPLMTVAVIVGDVTVTPVGASVAEPDGAGQINAARLVA